MMVSISKFEQLSRIYNKVFKNLMRDIFIKMSQFSLRKADSD